jgi:hypothetical protein
LDDIKRKIKLFYNEEDMYKNSTSFSSSPQKVDMNLRKNYITKKNKIMKIMKK